MSVAAERSPARAAFAEAGVGPGKRGRGGPFALPPGCPPGAADLLPGAKRARSLGGFGAAREAQGRVGYLRILFPAMSEEEVVRVLDGCGGDIDEAIAQLQGLQLRGEEGLVPPEVNKEGEQAAEPGLTPEEWISSLVQEMSASKDLDDARARGASFLRAFEQAVLKQAGAKDGEKGATDIGELRKENGILKRALAIQSARLQEAGAKDAELAKLRETVVQYQQQLRALETSNYALALHLKQTAHSGNPLPDNRHRDIF